MDWMNCVQVKLMDKDHSMEFLKNLTNWETQDFDCPVEMQTGLVRRTELIQVLLILMD